MVRLDFSPYQVSTVPGCLEYSQANPQISDFSIHLEPFPFDSQLASEFPFHEKTLC